MIHRFGKEEAELVADMFGMRQSTMPVAKYVDSVDSQLVLAGVTNDVTREALGLSALR